MIVETAAGRVKGLQEGRLSVFKGIPYAEPPVGGLRFKPPVPAAAWDGVYDATSCGNRAMQQQREAGYTYSEDCLNLNIWTPGTDGRKRPVIFFIHGGGHIEGSSSDPSITGERLIRDKEAVFVSVNYRLGAFGYLYLGQLLGREYAESGNCGLLDQLCALRWVRENIAAFGGDPGHVTLMGQSAGAKSAASLMVLPAAQGLFHGVILQSGGVQCIRDAVTASSLADLVMEALGAGGAQAGNILGMPAEAILAGQLKACGEVASVHLFGPVIDGVVVRETPEQYILSGRLQDMPVLIGYAASELMPEHEDDSFNPDSVAGTLDQTYGDNGDYLKGIYRKYCTVMKPSLAFGRLQTWYMYGNACLALTRLLAENGAKVWCYRWDFAGRTLPAHASELPYLFDRPDTQSEDGYLPGHAWMSQMMHESWMSFALEGDPNTPLLPGWPVCGPGEQASRMILDAAPHLEALDLHGDDGQFPQQVIRMSGPWNSKFNNGVINLEP